MRVCLRFVTQPVAKRQVWSDAPVVLDEHSVIRLTDVSKRISGIDAKLGCATAGSANLNRRKSLLEQPQGQLIAFDTRQAKTAGEGPTAAKGSLVRVLDVDVTYATAELDRMRAHLLRGKVIQLPTFTLATGVTDLRVTRAERAAHIQRGNGDVSNLLVAAKGVLKASLVDGCRVEYRGFRDLHVLICRSRVEGALRQREAIDALVFNARAVVVVTNDQRVAGVDGVVEAWTKKQVAPRHDKRLAEVEHIQIVVEHGGAHELVIVSFNASEIEKERGFALDHRTTQVHVVLANLKRRALAGVNCKRVARVEALVIEIKRGAATKLVGAGPRQNVYTRRRLIVLSGERILVNTNLANRVFR